MNQKVLMKSVVVWVRKAYLIVIVFLMEVNEMIVQDHSVAFSIHTYEIKTIKEIQQDY